MKTEAEAVVFDGTRVRRESTLSESFRERVREALLVRVDGSWLKKGRRAGVGGVSVDLFSFSRPVEVAGPAEAELAAVLEGLACARAAGAGFVRVVSDCLPMLAVLERSVWRPGFEALSEGPWSAEWVPREENEEADRLARRAARSASSQCEERKGEPRGVLRMSDEDEPPRGGMLVAAWESWGGWEAAGAYLSKRSGCVLVKEKIEKTRVAKAEGVAGAAAELARITGASDFVCEEDQAEIWSAEGMALIPPKGSFLEGHAKALRRRACAPSWLRGMD